MKHALLGFALLFSTGCAAGVAVHPSGPVGGHVQPLARADAVAIGHRWCANNGWQCELDGVDLIQGQTVWLLEFDAIRPHGKNRGKGHFKGKGKGHKKHGDKFERTGLTFAIDAWSGEVLDVRRG